MKKLDYIYPLDGLRALACLAVLVCHSAWNVPLTGWLGGTGVRVFFVLSGFLITRIIISQRGAEAAWKRFWLKRAARIFPAYYLVVVVGIVCWPHDGWLPYLVYINNYWMGTNHLIYTWSLAVEEQFYLVWPLIGFFLPLIWGRKIAVFYIPLAAIALIYLTYTTPAGDIFYFGTVPNGVLLMSGAVMAYYEGVVRGNKERTKLLSALCLMFGALSYLGIVGLLKPSGGGLLTAEFLRDVGIAVAVVLYVLSSPKRSSAALSWRPLMYIGTISYGLYLWHPLIYLLVFNLTGHNLPPLQWLASILVASASFYLYEKPIMGLVRRRLEIS